MAGNTIPIPIFGEIKDIGFQRLHLDISHSFAPRDFKAAQEFLAQYYANRQTLKAYRRDLERLLQWAWLIAEKSILKLTRDDIEAFIEFCLDPPKPWIGLQHAKRFIAGPGGKQVSNPLWRPFVVSISKAERKIGKAPNKKYYKLSANAIQALFAVLGSLYNHLIDEGLCKVNPVRQIKQKKSKYLTIRQGKREIRRLSDEQWQTVLEAAQQMVIEDPKQHERTLFIIASMYHMYLRISELVATERWQPQMNHFFKDSYDNWWFKTVGKGNKERVIAVNDEMLNALRRYRDSRGLAALPSPAEVKPLVIGLRDGKPITSTVQLRRIVQKCFDRAIDALKAADKSDEASNLQLATVHWLRHTGISDAINKYDRPIAHVRDDAGHSSSAITDIYNDADLQARHASANRRKNDDEEQK